MISSCSHPAPRTTTSASERLRHVLGAKISVYAEWQANCTDWSAVFDNMTSRDHNRNETEACKQKPFEVQVTCSTPCDQPGVDPHAVGTTTITVVPLELGPLTLTATSTRADTSQVNRVTLPEIWVVLPDRLELRCAAGPGSSDAPCGPEGVPASAPWVRPVVHVGETTEETTALRINGAPVPGAFAHTGRVSLAELFPDARAGAGVAPGTYAIALSVGTLTERWQVVVR